MLRDAIEIKITGIETYGETETFQNSDVATFKIT